MNRRQIVALLSAAAALALGGSATRLTYANLSPRDPARHVGRAIAYGPDKRQTLEVFAPVSAAGPLPVVVFFYGGGWISGKRQDYIWAARALASRGFLAVLPDYRVAPQVQYPAFVQDGAAVVRWAQDHAAAYGGDPARLMLMGHSAGAQIAFQLAMDDEFLKAAGVPSSHVRAAVGLSGPYDFNARAMPGFEHYPDPKAPQPITYAARRGRPPVLLIHGALDDDVDPQSSVRMDRALRAAGNSSTLRIYPALGHPDTVLALSKLFRDKAPILEESTRFMKAAAGSFP